jgi:hypothetical protein
MLQLLKGRRNVVFQHYGEPPHIHNVMTTFLTRQLPDPWVGRGESTSWPPNPLPPPSRLCSVRFRERRGLRSTDAYDPEQIKGLNTNTVSAKTYPLLQNAWCKVEYQSWCVQGNKRNTYWTCKRHEKKLFWVALYSAVRLIFVAVTFLPRNSCNHLHH